jgi:hypothetical protein
MTTTRERIEARADRREEWAEKASAKSDARFNAVHKLADGIPMGQPILVGHHSERHARADANRIHNGMSKACELADLAKHHTSKALGLRHQLDRTVFSDDSNAVEALTARMQEKIVKRDRMKLVNTLYRKGDAVGLAKLGLDLIQLQAKVAAVGYSWVKAPYESWELSNLGASIKTDEKRIKEVQARAERTEKADAAGGVAVEAISDVYSGITFAEKPEREILDALRTAGFYWGSGRWTGKTTAIPQCVLDLIPANDTDPTCAMCDNNEEPGHEH